MWAHHNFTRKNAAFSRRFLSSLYTRAFLEHGPGTQDSRLGGVSTVKRSSRELKTSGVATALWIAGRPGGSKAGSQGSLPPQLGPGAHFGRLWHTLILTRYHGLVAHVAAVSH